MASAGVAGPAEGGAPNLGMQEIDTCRICRGEGSLDEPLFHPCKCSGSIMYVHQDCLMEWLSHSQKKHCELCKTSFTFTKLYHPNMPSKLPTAVFLRKAASHVISRALYWARGVLVALTWLFWLPWTMRFVWWGLFWLADMGWLIDVEFQDGGLVQTNLSQTVANLTTSASPQAQSPHLPPRFGLYHFALWLVNATADVQSDSARNNLTSLSGTNMTESLARVRSRDTLLSGVPLFSHPVLDRVATDVLEGLGITLSLVAAIVLVLLIREWVVQQQPIINMGVDDNAPNPMPAQDEDERDAVLDNAENTPPATPEADPSEASAASAAPPATAGQSPPAPDRSGDIDVDASLAEWEQLVSLCVDAARLSKELKLFRRDRLADSNSNLGGAYTTQRCASLIIKFHETHFALAKIEDRAVKDADRIALSQVRYKIILLLDALRFLSDFEAEKLRGTISITKFRIDNYLGSSSVHNDVSRPESPDNLLDSILADNIVDSERLALDNAGSAQSRPSMPSRDASSLATNIQRRLQESVETSPVRGRQEQDSSSTGVGAGDSRNSDEGWQHVNVSDSVFSFETTRGPWQPSARAIDSTDIGLSRAHRPRSSSLPAPHSTAATNGEQSVLQNGYWSRQARPPYSRRRSIDHLSATGHNDTHFSRAQRISSPVRGFEGHQAHLRRAETADLVSPQRENSIGSQAPPHPDTRTVEVDGSHPPHPTQPTRPQDAWFVRAFDWLYGDIQPATENVPQMHENDEHVIDDVAGEEPFVAVNAAQGNDPPLLEAHAQNAAAPDQNQAVGRPALVPNEAELIEEAEELEGVLELIGMQGPITGLFTNALFTAVFVSCTTTLAVWVPFLAGKLVIVGVAHPVTLGDVVFRAGTGFINLFVDFCIFTAVYALQWFLNIPLNWISAWQGFSNNRYETPFLGPMSSWSLRLLNQTYERLFTEFGSVIRSTGAASSHLTLDSHEALSHIKGHFQHVTTSATSLLVALRQQVSSESAAWNTFIPSFASAVRGGLAKLEVTASDTLSAVKQVPGFLWAGQVTLTHNPEPEVVSAASSLAHWSALDRSLTVVVGYIALGVCAAIYFTRIAPIATTREGRKMENMVLEILQQTGGVSKVVLIISIEMLAFPLYCGLLLDIATLPLFGFSSIDTRLSFTLGSPWTSAFVHWFIGTCYMFHFALFVAMCRKILRKGVLYFIRDPDDPTFHPVRDVLERSVVSQLRKIMSSAMIYGGLVIICLGSVLWLLAFGISGILPIKWSSEGSFLGFPIDLVVYTTLKPALVRIFGPSDWIQQVYGWWFRRSARALRLSHYLFGDDNEDERVPLSNRKSDGPSIDRNRDMSGRWVRVPNNDQVRVGKGKRAWTDVDENNHRLDGQAEPDDVQGIGPNDPNFTKVYIPPHFRIRIAFFFASLWALTAGAGFALTVLPLLCGRSLFAILLPRTLWANDIYAFSAGLLALGGVAVAAVHLDYSIMRPVQLPVSFGNRVRTASRQYGTVMSERSRRVLRCVYVYGFVALVMPCLCALLGEFYILNPVHAWLSDGRETHTVQLLRSWTLGVQYVRIILSIIQWSSESTAARALRAVTARGYLNPDAGKATRYFFLPAIVASAMAILVPIPIGMLAAWFGAASDDQAKTKLISSLTFPAILGAVLAVSVLRMTLALLRGWQMHIRDEVYLIGERLHNYGERAVPKVKTS